MNKTLDVSQAKIAIIGLGYVGLPLAVEFSKKFPVLGFDIEAGRIAELQSGTDSTLEVSTEELAQAEKLTYSSNIDDLKPSNVYIVTVPTPIDKHKKPDLTPLEKASAMLSGVISKGDVVIYESTVFPGATEEVCIPIIEKQSGLVFNKDFFAGYSPERINPGDKEHRVSNILKITSGSTPEVANYVDELYRSIITAGTHKASSLKVAEAAKVIENVQRDANIALINELALIFARLNIDTLDVLKAAGTKWNFLPFRPGLVGGHCIGVDPYYLIYKAKSLGYMPNLILDARHINNGMSKIIVDKTIKYMVKYDKKLKNANILVMGATFKENCPDMRNSKVLDIIRELEEYECNVEVYDYWVDRSDRETKGLNFIDELPFGSQKYDAIIVAVAHDKFKEITTQQYKSMSKGEPIIIDVKGVVKKPTWRL